MQPFVALSSLTTDAAWYLRGWTSVQVARARDRCPPVAPAARRALLLRYGLLRRGPPAGAGRPPPPDRPARLSVAGSSPFSVRRRNATVVATAPSPITMNAARGELSATSIPPSDRPIARPIAASDSTAPIIRPCSCCGLRRWTRLISDGHSTPLPTPPTTAATHATASEGATANPTKAAPSAKVPARQHPSQRSARVAREHDAREDRACAPGRHEQPVAAVAGVQGRLGVGDLDRPAGLDEDECDRLGQQQRAQRGSLVNVAPGRRRRARTESSPACSDVRVQVEQQRPADQERADVDEQRGLSARRRGDDAADQRSRHERDREGDVERCVRPALGLLCSAASSSSGGVAPSGALRPVAPTRATSARSSALAASAAVPSIAASSSTPGSQKRHSRTASAAVTTASMKYSALSSEWRSEDSTRATTAGTTKAGSACQASSSAATASALWVWSKTASERATRPTQLPSRLTV